MRLAARYTKRNAEIMLRFHGTFEIYTAMKIRVIVGCDTVH
jgi:hypothetical protein